MEAIELGSGWLQVKVPLPMTLRWVNSYLIPYAGSYTLVDPGLHTEQAEREWEALLARHGIGYGAIRQIVLTHQHPDHYGLAGWFQQRCGAPVRMSRRAHRYARRLWRSDSGFAAELRALFGLHGMPEEELAAIERHLASFLPLVEPQPQVTYVEAGEELLIGGLLWQAIDTPGHADGHLCLYEPQGRRMLCGDQVLPQITPNISLVPGEPDDPLQAFLASLERLLQYPVAMAFPGHRDPFPDFATRILELQAHHRRRLDRLAQWLTTPATGYALCMRLFGERATDSAHNLRFAMAETLAHLQRLVYDGRAVLRRGDDGVLRYVGV
ncbi:MBL fold metallo-hydrolase [Paenibacillus sp. IB182496]|uniref:MBL fold metallo-hydrolase n=2 Tax=Paenibacillus sabuli TaxID=2772509 RepID=A0A927BQ39_9BACL|nr:MBL fold metallo-hydrolase [Paenibacillus sabuli]